MNKYFYIALSLWVLNCSTALSSLKPDDIKSDNNTYTHNTAPVADFSDNAQSEKSVVASVSDPTNILCIDALKMIMDKASKKTSPGHMASVNKRWRNVMRENTPFQPNLKFETLNPFMKNCLRINGKARLLNGTLNGTISGTLNVPVNGVAMRDIQNQAIQARFSNLEQEFCIAAWKCDLPTFLERLGERDEKVHVVSSLKEFFIVYNQKKRTLLFISPFDEVVTNDSNLDEPVAKMKNAWDKNQTPARLFLRNEGNADFNSFGYLDIQGISKALAIDTLKQNWKYAALGVMVVTYLQLVGWETGLFTIIFAPEAEIATPELPSTETDSASVNRDA